MASAARTPQPRNRTTPRDTRPDDRRPRSSGGVAPHPALQPAPRDRHRRLSTPGRSRREDGIGHGVGMRDRRLGSGAISSAHGARLQAHSGNRGPSSGSAIASTIRPAEKVCAIAAAVCRGALAHQPPLRITASITTTASTDGRRQTATRRPSLPMGRDPLGQSERPAVSSRS